MLSLYVTVMISIYFILKAIMVDRILRLQMINGGSINVDHMLGLKNSYQSAKMDEKLKFAMDH